MKEIQTDEEFVKLLKSRRNIIVDFYAKWCGPCKLITPFVEGLAHLLQKEVTIVKVDVDNENMRGTLEKYRVTSMPTFIFIREGVEIDTVKGANKDKIIEKCEKVFSLKLE